MTAKQKRRKLAKANGYTHYYEYIRALKHHVIICGIMDSMSTEEILTNIKHALDNCIREQLFTGRFEPEYKPDGTKINKMNDAIYNAFVQENVSSHQMPGVSSILEYIESK